MSHSKKEHACDFVSTTGGTETVLLPDQAETVLTSAGPAIQKRPLGAVAIGPTRTQVTGKEKIEAVKAHPAYGTRFVSCDEVEAKVEKASTPKKTKPSSKAKTPPPPKEPDADNTGGNDLHEVGYHNVNQALAYCKRELGASDEDLKALNGDAEKVKAFGLEHGVDFHNL